MPVAVIIAASGTGSRMGGQMPKQFQMLGTKPILAHTIEAFNKLDLIGQIVIAAPEKYVAHTQEISAAYPKVQAVAPGGKNRAQSVYAAAKLLSPEARIVLIHDGVRPFVTSELIMAVIEATKTHGAAIAGTPLTDTLKQVDAKVQITHTPDRSRFWHAQTPQGFTYDLLMKAYAQAQKDGILDQATDDSSLVEHLGHRVQIVASTTKNIKITTPEDLRLANLLIEGDPQHEEI